MDTEMILYLISCWKGNGRYEIIKEQYREDFGNDYLDMFESYFLESKTTKELIQKYFSYNVEDMRTRDIMRILTGVLYDLITIDLLSIDNVIWPQEFSGLLKSMSLKEMNLFLILVSAEQNYYGGISYLPTKVFQPIFKTRDISRIKETVNALSKLNLRVGDKVDLVPIFEDIGYHSGKIYFKFSYDCKIVIREGKMIHDANLI